MEQPAGAVSQPFSPLARDYVDMEAYVGVAWLGTAADDRWVGVGPSFGGAIDIGRAPYWGGIYAIVANFHPKSGVVDPSTGTTPNLVTTSAGWRGKAAVHLGGSFCSNVTANPSASPTTPPRSASPPTASRSERQSASV